MEDSRKLKRGLRDISPLFSEPQVAYPPRLLKESLVERPTLQLVSMFHPRYQKNSQVLDFWMARHILKSGYQTAVLSVSTESRPAGKERAIFHEDVPCKMLTLEEFGKVCSPHAKTAELGQSSLLFINFSWLQAAYFRKVIPVLDKTVLWINADLEMLTETYRQLKWLAQQNSKTEFCIAFDGSAADQTASTVFEKFSQMVSRNLKVGLNWLGTCEALSSLSSASGNFNWESLVQKREGTLTLSEKRGLADYFMAAS